VERLAGDHFVQAQNIYLKLGNLYERLDNHAEAIQQYKQSLQLAKRTSGPKSLEVSVILNNLALSHQKLA
jgi:tetratricopeptide (TPR) repeat protein